MLIRPRLTDFHNIHLPQNELGFAIPFFEEDIPLYVDPFLLWKSPSLNDKGLHQILIAAFNHLGVLHRKGRTEEAINQIIVASECDEVGLGNSGTRVGRRFGRGKAEEIIQLFDRIPYYRDHGFRHIEEIQLFVDQVGKDRISDIACSFLKSFLVDYTIDQCMSLDIPTEQVELSHVYNANKQIFETLNVKLPTHPNSHKPILLTPKHWLRHIPWISFEQYFRDSCPQDDIAHRGEELTRVKVLTYNRENYGVIDAYVKERERTQADCATDPLFKQIPVLSARRKLAEIKKLPTGKDDNADRRYELALGALLPTLLYPHLDFAQEQARTDSGVSIRDLIFYNSRQHPFLKEVMDDYKSRQITFELKNVERIKREHVDQLNRYLNEEMGKFGIFITRNPLKKAEVTRTIDLWSGQRKAVIVLTDSDIEQMVEVYESKQRHPLDVIVRAYTQYRRSCPG